MARAHPNGCVLHRSFLSNFVQVIAKRPVRLHFKELIHSSFTLHAYRHRSHSPRALGGRTHYFIHYRRIHPSPLGSGHHPLPHPPPAGKESDKLERKVHYPQHRYFDA